MLRNNEQFLQLIKQIGLIFSDVDQYMQIYKIDHLAAEIELKLYSELKNRATLGEADAKNYIVNKYTIILMNLFGFNEDKVEEFICFKNVLDNEPGIIFEILLQIYDMSELIDKYNLGIRIIGEEIKFIAQEEMEAIRSHFSLANKVRLLSALIYSIEYGQDVIDTLQHHNINEIGIIDKDYIYIIFKGNKIHLEFLSFCDKSVIENVQKKTTQNSTVNYDQQNPTVVAAKNNSSRITVAGYDVTPTADDFYYNERIFNLRKITLEEMRDSYSTINDLIYRFLCINQQGRGSHFVTGADMGVGKSTFLLAMMEKVPDRWGIGILDSQNELQARKKYPWKNILTLLVNTKRTISECFEFMLKTSRDVLYVGEITKPSEVAELINASLRLNSGVGATMHSLDPTETITNIRNLMMRTDMYNDSETAEADIARGLDIIVHLEKLSNGRIVVDSIYEVQYVEKSFDSDRMCGGNQSAGMTNLIRLAEIAICRYLSQKSYHYNEVIRYDKDTDRWLAVNLPSETYFRKIGKYVDKNTIEEFKKLFTKHQNKAALA